MGPARVKRLSVTMLDAFLPALGIRLAIVDDPAAIASMERRWEQRCESNVRSGCRISRRLLDRARPVILQELIDAAALARAQALSHAMQHGQDTRGFR